MRPMAVRPALPTWAGALVSCPSTWKVPCQVPSASSAVTTSVPAVVAGVVPVVLVQPVASTHPTITTVAAVGTCIRIKCPMPLSSSGMPVTVRPGHYRIQDTPATGL